MGAEPAGHRRPFLARRLADDPGFRDRVEAAERLGIPPSRLDGREPAETTRHYYNRRGRLIRSVTTREPAWTEQDRAEILALALRRAQWCPCGCGQRYADTTSDEQAGPSFVAERVVCRARLALLEAQKAHETKDIIGGARLWTVRKRG